MTKEEALQQLEDYKKPLDRSTATFGNIVDDYYTTSEVLEITRNQIVTSLRKKGLPLTEGAKLSEVPSEILKLLTMEKKLEIAPPNVGAVIDTNKKEYNVTKINTSYSPDGVNYSRSGSDEYLTLAYTDNFIAFASLSSRYVRYKKYNNSSFLEFTTPQYDTNQFCSAHDGDIVYAFNQAGPTNVMNCNAYDLSDADLSLPKETHSISNCNNIVWCDTIDGVIHLAYRETSSGTYYFGTYNFGDSAITKRFSIGSDVPVSITYDDKYFYICIGTRYVFYNTRDFASPTMNNVPLSISSRPTFVAPFGNKLLVTYGYNGVHLFFGIDSPSPGLDLATLAPEYTSVVAPIDDTYFVVSYSTPPYARLFRLDYDKATFQYSATNVGNFNNINTSNMNDPSMIIAKDLLGKQYLAFARYKSFMVEGINAEYEFDLERRD